MPVIESDLFDEVWGEGLFRPAALTVVLLGHAVAIDYKLAKLLHEANLIAGEEREQDHRADSSSLDLPLDVHLTLQPDPRQSYEAPITCILLLATT